jgi:hypothetical protein
VAGDVAGAVVAAGAVLLSFPPPQAESPSSMNAASKAATGRVRTVILQL